MARQLLLELESGGPYHAPRARMLSKLFWVLTTVVFTFLFIVLFENGTVNYVDNCVTEYHEVVAYFGEKPHKKGDSSDKVVP